MQHRDPVAVLCQLYPGLISDRCVFVLQLADKTAYYGKAPIEFCWNMQGQLLTIESRQGDGLVAARFSDQDVGAGYAAVELPLENDVVAVPQSSIRARPTKIVSPSSKI